MNIRYIMTMLLSMNFAILSAMERREEPSITENHSNPLLIWSDSKAKIYLDRWKYSQPILHKFSDETSDLKIDQRSYWDESRESATCGILNHGLVEWHTNNDSKPVFEKSAIDNKYYASFRISQDKHQDFLTLTAIYDSIKGNLNTSLFFNSPEKKLNLLLIDKSITALHRQHKLVSAFIELTIQKAFLTSTLSVKTNMEDAISQIALEPPLKIAAKELPSLNSEAQTRKMPRKFNSNSRTDWLLKFFGGTRAFPGTWKPKHGQKENGNF